MLLSEDRVAPTDAKLLLKILTLPQSTMHTRLEQVLSLWDTPPVNSPELRGNVELLTSVESFVMCSAVSNSVKCHSVKCLAHIKYYSDCLCWCDYQCMNTIMLSVNLMCR